MSLQTRLVEYGDVETTYEGLLAFDDTWSNPKPGVLIAHTIRGRSSFEEGKAKALVELGYTAFALDVYGKMHIGANNDKASALMNSLIADRIELQQRLSLSLRTMAAFAEVDESKMAAIGFCFGGLCTLDLARIDAPLSGVVSFHGLFEPPGNTRDNKISASVLALHGWDDPLATPDSVVALGEELTRMGADWQLHGYGNTMHAFTNPAANDTGRGTVYDASADKRSWIAMQHFLREKFQ